MIARPAARPDQKSEPAGRSSSSSPCLTTAAGTTLAVGGLRSSTSCSSTSFKGCGASSAMALAPQKDARPNPAFPDKVPGARAAPDLGGSARAAAALPAGAHGAAAAGLLGAVLQVQAVLVVGVGVGPFRLALADAVLHVGAGRRGAAADHLRLFRLGGAGGIGRGVRNRGGSGEARHGEGGGDQDQNDLLHGKHPSPSGLAKPEHKE